MDDDGFFSGKRIGVAGLGLIGGSLAMSLRRAGFYVAGFDISAPTVDAALTGGAVDEASADPAAVLGCDVIFIALYPEDIIAFVSQNAASIKEDAVVIDCCGVKEYILQSLAPSLAGRRFTFIGGHPMAGTEKIGFSAASAGLFQNASFILTPGDDCPAALVDHVGALIRRAGFKRIVVTTPAHHDRMIAFTSQLPHALACAYVKSPYCPQHSGYSAGSYRDVSRVAHINPELWAELFCDNSAALCEEIDGLIKNLGALRDAVAARDRPRLEALLRESRKIKDGVDDER